MWCGVVSLFPEMFAALHYGITGRAIQNKLLEVQLWNPRDFTQDKYQTVDDRPYGGGPGMVMMTEPLQKALQAAKSAAPGQKAKVIYLSPQGKQFTQRVAEDLVRENVVFLAGRYEGIDERIITLEIDEEWSIGDYILSGGEFAAMVMIDTLARLLPGALGDEESVAQDSLTSGFLKYPQYTRPAQFKGLEVPEVLLSGDHKAIARWRIKQALGRTWLKRPDLLARKTLTQHELELLLEYITEQRGELRSTNHE